MIVFTRNKHKKLRPAQTAAAAADPDFKEPTTNKRGRPKGVANKGTRASKRRNPSNT